MQHKAAEKFQNISPSKQNKLLDYLCSGEIEGDNGVTNKIHINRD